MNDFQTALQSYLNGLARLRQEGASEDSIRDAFLQFLRAAFPRLSLADPIVLEKHIPALRVRGGFADALYGDLIFEFKRGLDNNKCAEGRDELERYLNNQKYPDRFFGLLTDGETLQVYALRDGKLAQVDELRLDASRADHCHLWLDCYLFHEKHLEPTANDITLRFGEHSPTFWQSRRVLDNVWQKAKHDAAAQTKYAEWQSLLSIVYGSPVGDEDLFLRHTYLALFARVLAYVALKRKAPAKSELLGLVAGETFEQMGLDNFVSEDFFSWPRTDPDVETLLSSLATRLTVAYELSAINEDLLKGLYQELVDPATRHDLGEFYTPDWLAELTLRQAGFPFPAVRPKTRTQPSLLDPACGSGTFLFIAIRLLREAGFHGAGLVELCASQMAGMDVHPLAVTIARTNFVLALSQDLPQYRKRLSLPIYMADSLSITEALGQGQLLTIPVDCESLAQLAGKKRPHSLPRGFDVPPQLAHSPHDLHSALDKLLELADPDIPAEDASEGFRSFLKDLNTPQGHVSFWLHNLRLMRWLLEPPATDSVWRFILKNACQPALLAHRKFRYVVGNPPWLSYRFIQRRDYQDRVRRLVMQRYRLLHSSDAHLFTQMELATLFFAYCADHYLADGGTLAFVMPRSILTGAKQHVEFRKQYVATAKLIIDCEQVTPLFKVPACAVIWNKGQANQPGQQSVPTVQLSGQLPTHNASYEQAQQALQQTSTTFTVPTPRGQSPYFERMTQGATIVPRCLWFVRPDPEAKVIDRRRPQLQTDPQIEPQAKPPWKGIRLRGSVEVEFLFATLLSDDMLPFGWRQFSLVVLPWMAGRLISANEAIRQGKTGLADWLRKADANWRKHRKSQEDLLNYLNWQGKLTAQSPKGMYKLLYNTSGTHLCACVVDTTNLRSWQVYNLPVQGFLADTTTYWLETKDEGEAHYLSAFLNAACVDDFIKPFQPKGAFGAPTGKGQRHIHRRPFEVLPIPQFDPNDQRHKRLAELSKQCHQKVAQFVTQADEKTLSQPVGRLRQQVRQALTQELVEIDGLCRSLLGFPP
jgi:hypothetical protein